MAIKPRKVRTKKPKLQPLPPVVTPVASLPSEPKTLTPLQTLIAEAPNLPPLPPNVVQYVEFTFRPKYEEFIQKLWKLADEST